MKIFAIDPGPEQSAIVLYEYGAILRHHILNNIEVAQELWAGPCRRRRPVVVIEQIEHYGRGMPVGRDIFDTCMWIGRFTEAWYRCRNCGLETVLLPRRAVKLTLCGSVEAKDKNIRQAIIDHYGGQHRAIGNKKCPACHGKGWRGREHADCLDCDGSGWAYPPGPLAEIHADEWSALALALTYERGERR